jgi:hypothetical protein
MRRGFHGAHSGDEVGDILCFAGASVINAQPHPIHWLYQSHH